jgi:hypothetical protein
MVALADLLSLFARCCIYRKVKERQVYTINIVMSSCIIVAALTVILPHFKVLDKSIFANEYIIGLVLFCIRTGLNLQ